jgi:hypothetical protein
MREFYWQRSGEMASTSSCNDTRNRGDIVFQTSHTAYIAICHRVVEQLSTSIVGADPMTDASITISMEWATIGLATTQKATALTDRFITVGAMSQC